MRLKSLEMQQRTKITIIGAKNQRIKTCVSNMFLLLYLLSSEVWSLANINYKENRYVRQVKAEKIVNYEEASSNTYQQPHFTGNRSVIVQLFEWKFIDIAAECRDFLGPQGYAGVQISPVLEHTVVKTSDIKHPWWERYEVVSYRLATRSGDETEFWSMTRICNDHGVRIYADIVLNHMAAPLQHLIPNLKDDNNEEENFIVNTLLETNVNISQLNYSNVTYTQKDFHRPHCLVLENTQDAHEIRNCQLNGHPDLDHSRTTVQKHIVQMLNKFIDMGVAGFRIDTAKYIWPRDLKNIFQQVKNLNTEFNFEKNSRPFLYYDVFDLGLDTISKTEYITYGVVSEYLYPAELSTIINGKVPLSSLINWGPALGFVPHDDSVVFIDSHDTQRGLPKQLGMNKMLTYKQRLKYIMANAFMLVHPYGNVKRIMSSYYFTDVNQGPPTDDEEGEEIRSPKFNEQQKCTKESGWVCEHRWPELLSVLKVANYFKVPGQEDFSVIYFQTNGPNQVAFCRGHKAFVAINNDWDMDFEMEVFACLEPGIYCDMVTGGKKEGKEECYGQRVLINEQGYTKLQLKVVDGNNEQENGEELEEEEELGRLENYGILVIYVESKIHPKQEEANSQEKTKHENSKADDNEAEEVETDAPNDEVETEDSNNDNDDKQKELEETETEQIDDVGDANKVPQADEEPADVNEDENPDIPEDVEKVKDNEVEEEANEEKNSDDSPTAEEGESKEEEPDEEEPKEEESKEEETKIEEPQEEELQEEEPQEEEPQEDELKEEEIIDEEPKESDAEDLNDAEDPAADEGNENPAEGDAEHEETNADETASKEGEEVDLVKETSAETIAPAENLVEEPNEEAESNIDDIEHNQSRTLEEKPAIADEQIEEPLVVEEEEEQNKEDTEQLTAKPQDIVAAGVLINPSGNG